MTKEELKQTGRALISLSEGKCSDVQVQLNDDSWRDWKVESDSILLYLRVKPEPKKRLMRHDELPPFIWIKRNDQWRQMLGVHDDGRLFLAGQGMTGLTIEDLHKEGCIWSPDRKTINFFFVEDV